MQGLPWQHHVLMSGVIEPPLDIFHSFIFCSWVFGGCMLLPRAGQSSFGCNQVLGTYISTQASLVLETQLVQLMDVGAKGQESCISVDTPQLGSCILKLTRAIAIM